MRKHDPPNAGRGSAGFWKWVKAIGRTLVTGKTLTIAFYIALWVVRIVHFLKRHVGGL